MFSALLSCLTFSLEYFYTSSSHCLRSGGGCRVEVFFDEVLYINSLFVFASVFVTQLLKQFGIWSFQLNLFLFYIVGEY